MKVRNWNSHGKSFRFQEKQRQKFEERADTVEQSSRRNNRILESMKSLTICRYDSVATLFG